MTPTRRKRCASCNALEGHLHNSRCNYARYPDRYPGGAVYVITGDYFTDNSSTSSSSCDTSSSDGGSCA